MMGRPSIAELLDTLPQQGFLTWIGLRPERRVAMLEPDFADIDPSHGLVGDRYAGRSDKLQVTLVQHEHIVAIASILGSDVLPAQLRRNLVVRGINLLALKNRQYSIADTLLEGTGLCHPCSRMEEIFGAGGYNAVRGHGGITARVLVGGRITCGDIVALHAQT